MNSTTINLETSAQTTALSRGKKLGALFSGAILPLSFAPFHFPGLALLSLALLFSLLKSGSLKHAFQIGLLYGLSFFGLGVSWIYVSIHEYGHLHGMIAFAITLVFILYLSLYLGFFALAFRAMTRKANSLWRCTLFSALWCIFEFLRAKGLGGFPWLSLGFGQIDSPLRHLLPIVGVFGVGFITCFLSGLLALSFQKKERQTHLYLMLFVTLLLAPLLLKSKTWTHPGKEKISAAVVQANLSMRDKWDEALFWKLFEHYQTQIESLLGKKQLIVLPESAIPVPSHYISEPLEYIDKEAKTKQTAILLGIPIPTPKNPTLFYNGLLGLGEADGAYFKRHLVAFGEFIPSFLSFLHEWLFLPPNLSQGPIKQPLMHVKGHAIASLICYELAFPELLRTQLPEAEWIVSVSDDGWFGRSLAVFQHVQMAQTLSKQTERDQILANNDGLSAMIQSTGDIINILPAFSAGVLDAHITPQQGNTPWAEYGDRPFIMGCLVLLLLYAALHFNRIQKQQWIKN